MTTKIEKPVQSTFDVEKIKKYLHTMNLASNLTSSEVEQFIEIAQSFELNPFKREIYANKYGDKFSVIVGFETYIKRAERSGLLSGWNVTTEGSIDRNNFMNSDLRAVITIYRKDFEHAFVHDVYYIEYVGRRRDGSITDFWKNKPFTMIKKVAMAQGFRLCFSDELGGMPYTSEELSTIESEAIVVESNKPERKKKESNVQGLKVIESVEEAKSAAKNAIRIRTLLELIRNSSSIEELVQIWKNNEDLHAEVSFKNAMTTKKNELQSVQEVVPFVEVVPEPEPVIQPEPEPKQEVKPEPVNEFSEELSKRRQYYFDLIEETEVIEEIIDVTFNEHDTEILKKANEKLQKLYSLQDENRN
jgi:phage recombination protein Bet